jgi:hypothetical protein
VDVKPALRLAMSLMADVPPGSVVLIAHRNPDCEYNLVFADLFPLSEVIQHAAHRLKLAAIPDIYFLMYSAALHPWGYDPHSLSLSCNNLKLAFVIAPPGLDGKNGFVKLASIDTAQMQAPLAPFITSGPYVDQICLYKHTS